MDKRQQKGIDRAARVGAGGNSMEIRKVGAPPKAYIFSTFLIGIACCGAIFASIYFARQSADGTLGIMAVRQWLDAHPAWMFAIAISMLAYCVAACDVLVWNIASLAARLRYRERVTARQIMSWRLGFQIALAALSVLLFALFPRAFPPPTARSSMMLFSMVGIPVALASIHLLRASVY